MNYPLLSEYEIAIKKSGSSILNLDEKYEFVANRTAPIKFYNFGSGTFAGVFKVKNIKYQDFALRCFLNGGDPKRIERTKQITEFLSQMNETWLCKSKLIERGIYIKNHHFPAILMEWTSGKLINEYVSEIINFNSKIVDLQDKLVLLSQSLEKNRTAHGDIQSGNILVEKIGSEIVLKLVDYDAMYIPNMMGQKAVEIGHSSFQHNRRSKDIFDEKIDRFSFWLLLTALEALKFDKTLWNKDMSGGFNDGDNFLFRAKDIASPQNSILVSRLRYLRQPSVNYYLDILLSNTENPQRNEVKLYDAEKKVNLTTPTTEPLTVPDTPKAEQEYFQIDSDVPNANIFVNSLVGLKLGTTPLKLDLSHASNLIIIEKSGVQKALYLNKNERIYFIKLAAEKTIVNPSNYHSEKIEPEKVEPADNESSDNFPSWILGIAVVVALLLVVFANVMLGKKEETVEIVNTADSAAINNIDTSENSIIDSAVTIIPEAQPEISNPFDTKYTLTERANMLLRQNQNLSGYELANDSNSNWDVYTMNLIHQQRDENGLEFPYIVRGDFDGNSKYDIAFIAKKSGKRKMFIFMNTESGNYYNIDFEADGISYAKPSVYESFPGDGGTNERINILNDAIFVSYFESSASVHYYDGGIFKSLIISD